MTNDQVKEKPLEELKGISGKPVGDSLTHRAKAVIGDSLGLPTKTPRDTRKPAREEHAPRGAPTAEDSPNLRHEEAMRDEGLDDSHNPSLS
jgi:hypothetical protein